MQNANTDVLKEIASYLRLLVDTNDAIKREIESIRSILESLDAKMPDPPQSGPER